MSRRIIFAATDLGGMNALIPVIEAVRHKPAQFITLGLFAGPALVLAKKKRIRCLDMNGVSEDILKRTVSEFRPDVILTGTSSGITLEKRLVPIAHSRRTPIFAVLDAWVNYACRFGLRQNGSFSEADLPDKIFVMDELAKRGMAKAGVPRDHLLITGNPFFETFRRIPPRRAIKKSALTVLFVDQFFSELIKKGIKEDFGYDELQVLANLVAELKLLTDEYRIIIKLHPGSTDAHRYDQMIRSSKSRIRLAGKKLSLDTLLKNVDLVVGMNSAVLFEVALRGRPVVSYQLRQPRRSDPLMSNRLGISIAAYNQKELRQALRAALLAQSEPSSLPDSILKYTKSGATRKIIKQLFQ